MLKISSPNNLIIPYHNKIISKVQSMFKIIHTDFHTSNPIVSGSYAINLVYSPDSDFNDIDIYFDSEDNFNKAQSLLISNNDFSLLCETSNAFSYKNKNELNVQLIKKFFLPPDQLIYKHDFIVASVAIQNSNVYTTLETFKAWSKSELSFRDYQFDNYKNDLKATFFRLNNIIDRLHKYSNRYSLDISSETFDDLFALYNKLNSSEYSNDLNQKLNLQESEEPLYDYYGKKINTYLTYKNILNNLRQFLISESNIKNIPPLSSLDSTNEDILF